MKNAVLAIEDARFYEHGGVDYKGMLRAGAGQHRAGVKQPGRLHHHDAGGAQLLPVVREDLHPQDLRNAAGLQDRAASSRKDQILEIYMNQIYLGKRAYGFAAAARDLFRQAAEGHHDRRGGDAGRPAQGAVGLQPGRQPEARARARQQYIIERMHENGFITADAARGRARSRSCSYATRRPDVAVHAEYVAEMVRQLMYAQYGDEAYTRGLNVYTTLDRGRPGRRLPRAAQGHHGLRAPPGLPRPGGASSTCRPTRRSSTTRSTTRWPTTRQRRRDVGRGAARRAQEGRGRAAERRDGRRSPATA